MDINIKPQLEIVEYANIFFKSEFKDATIEPYIKVIKNM